MSYCINRKCKNRQNEPQLEYCASCGSSLLINDRYRLVKPIRSLEIEHHTEVWKVQDIHKSQWKVMKILHTDIAKSVAFLEQEMEILKSLDNPKMPKVEDDCFFSLTLNINNSQKSINEVDNINDVCRDNNYQIELYCLVMEYIEGENLEDFVNKHGKISQYQALNWLKQLLEILKYLHTNFCLHRDIKPSNIILKPNGQLALIDFGSVRQIKESYYLKLNKQLFFQKIGINPSDDSNITKIVSEGYTAPEQLEGAALPQSDFYALGRTMVHLVTGKHPIYFYSSNLNKLIWQQDAKQISKPLMDLINDLMQSEAAARPQNPQAIANRLTKWSLWWREWLSIKGLMALMVSSMLLGVFGIKIVNAINEQNYQRYYEIGREKLLEDDLPQAREYLEKAIKINPNKPSIYNDLGLVCEEQSDIICAISQYEKAIELSKNQNDNSHLTTYYNSAMLYENIGNKNAIDKAAQQYLIVSNGLNSQEINVKIMSLNALNNYARLQILYKQKNRLALEILESTLAETEKLLNQPEMERNQELLTIKSTLWKNIGWALLQEGELEKAKNSLEEAKQVDKEKKPEIYCLLAQVEAHLDMKKSFDLWQKCRDYPNEKDLPEVTTWQNYAIQYLKSK